jgi:hypothetical protein
VAQGLLLFAAEQRLAKERAMAKHGEEWDLWFPQAAATGLPFARGRVDHTDIMLVHAAPPMLTVTVRSSTGQVLASARDLAQTAETPIARLTRRGDHIERVDIWPTDDDLGRLVILPGGEVGTLRQWWNADDHSEWRWQLELYNHR